MVHYTKFEENLIITRKVTILHISPYILQKLILVINFLVKLLENSNIFSFNIYIMPTTYFQDCKSCGKKTESRPMSDICTSCGGPQSGKKALVGPKMAAKKRKNDKPRNRPQPMTNAKEAPIINNSSEIFSANTLEEKRRKIIRNIAMHKANKKLQEMVEEEARNHTNQYQEPRDPVIDALYSVDNQSGNGYTKKKSNKIKHQLYSLTVGGSCKKKYKNKKVGSKKIIKRKM